MKYGKNRLRKFTKSQAIVQFSIPHALWQKPIHFTENTTKLL